MSETAAVRGSHAPLGVAEARRALLAWVDEAGEAGRVFLQARLSAAGGGYAIRHVADASIPATSLEFHTDPFAARAIAQVTDGGEHRPLKTAPTLRRGWLLADLDEMGLWTALDYLYPACAVHWHAAASGTLRVTHWRDTAGRQSGIYSPVGLLTDAAVRNTIRACCGDMVCLRQVAWQIDGDTPLGLAPEPGAGDVRIPCPEACSMFVSFARKTLTLERSPRQEVPGLGALNPAEFEQIRELTFAAASGALPHVREGEFSEPLNSRRIRYLAARLAEAAADPDAEAEQLPCEGCPRVVPCAGCPLAA